MSKKSGGDSNYPKEKIITPEIDSKGHGARHLLNVFAGKWNTEGETRTSPVVKITGTDTYEWLEGGYFLIHYVDVHIGKEPMKAIEIIGYDASRNIYPTHSFDSQGNSSAYESSVNNGIWTFKAESERATVFISNNGNTMTAHWEQLTNDNTWIPWMEITLKKEK